MRPVMSLLKIMEKEGVDYFVTYSDQIPAKYFFARYIKSDIYSIAMSIDKEIIINPSRTLLKDKKIAVYLRDLSYEKAVTLKQRYRLKDVSKQIDELRMIKSFKEIDKIKKACYITTKIVDEITAIFNKTLSEKSLTIEIKKAFLSYGVEAAFNPIVAFNKNTSYVHHNPTSYNPSKKHIILIDMGARFHHYNADITRTFILSKSYKKVYEDVFNVLSILEDEAKENTSLKHLNELAKDLLKPYGKASFIHHHLLGHGIGLEVHESPSFREDIILQKNMVITLEPAVYFKNRFGVRLENTYVIKKKKAKSLC